MEVKFKGILKDEEIVDASTICKCRPMNKLCQRCFIQKDENYYFFNTKNNQIVAIPTKMMLSVEEWTTINNINYWFYKSQHN